MGRALEQRLGQPPLDDPVLAGMLNLIIAGAALREQHDLVCGRFGLTSSAFNVLRSLRDARAGRPRGEIARRLINRASDVTRLIDGLARRGLVRRVRSRRDRRLSLTRITPRGLALLERIEPAIAYHRDQVAPRLSSDEWAALGALCERLYADER
jgi:DNA-binding MarR family transcriptional regulator